MEIVKVQLREAFPFCDFERGDFELNPQDKVVVTWQQGLALATVVSRPFSIREGAKYQADGSIVRIATEEDLYKHEKCLAQQKEANDFCLEQARRLGLNLKLVSVEFLLEGNKAIFYFTAEGRIDFRELVKEMARQFHTRIEMRQIGVRDEAKMVGGLGYCGRPLCCCTFLKEFCPVSIRAAKDQNLALNLDKISGLCGRLMCCLTFEKPLYEEMKNGLPRCGKWVETEKGLARVVKLKVLEGTVIVRLADGQAMEVPAEKVSCPKERDA